MKEELNIVAILKGKPKGTRLWSDTFGEIELFKIMDDGFNVIHHGSNFECYNTDGTMFSEGNLCVFPSNVMRDWGKFTWKKGDVLCYGIDNYCIFDMWANNNYTEFFGVYSSADFSNAYETLYTDEWTKADDNIKEAYIKRIEEFYGGKLNLETLTIEKHPEFKNGDIVTQNVLKGANVYIIKNCIDKIDNKYNYYARYNTQDKEINYNDWAHISPHAKFATDSEKQQLFDALAREGKAWDADKKQIVDIPKKHDFKPMDLCLMRNYPYRWELCQYAYQDDFGEGDSCYHTLNGHVFHNCIPYNNETKHLLGTKDKWKGDNNG